MKNHAVTCDQNANKDIMEIDFHRYQLETDRSLKIKKKVSLSHNHK